MDGEASVHLVAATSRFAFKDPLLGCLIRCIQLNNAESGDIVRLPNLEKGAEMEIWYQLEPGVKRGITQHPPPRELKLTFDTQPPGENEMTLPPLPF